MRLTIAKIVVTLVAMASSFQAFAVKCFDDSRASRDAKIDVRGRDSSRIVADLGQYIQNCSALSVLSLADGIRVIEASVSDNYWSPAFVIGPSANFPSPTISCTLNLKIRNQKTNKEANVSCTSERSCSDELPSGEKLNWENQKTEGGGMSNC